MGFLDYLVANALANRPAGATLPGGQPQPAPAADPLANAPGFLGIAARNRQPAPPPVAAPGIAPGTAAVLADLVRRAAVGRAARLAPPPQTAQTNPLANAPGFLGIAARNPQPPPVAVATTPVAAQLAATPGPTAGGVYHHPSPGEIASALAFRANQRAIQSGQAEQVAANAPELGEPVARAAADATGTVATALDKPRQWNAGEQGRVLYESAAWDLAKTPQEAEAMGLLPPGGAALMPGGADDPAFKQAKLDAFVKGAGGPFGSIAYPFNIADPVKKEQVLRGIVDAYLHGYTAYGQEAPTGAGPGQGGNRARVPVARFDPGGRAAWEYLQGTRGWLARGINDAIYDPTNLGLGPVEEVGQGIARAGAELAGREGASALARAAGRVAEGAGTVLRAPNAVLNEAPSALIEAPLRAAGEAIARVPGLGFLVREEAGSAARALQHETEDALRLREGMAETPAGTTPLGGVPEPEPRPTHALPTGPLVSKPDLRTAPVNELPPGAEAIPQPATRPDYAPAHALPTWATTEPIAMPGVPGPTERAVPDILPEPGARQVRGEPIGAEPPLTPDEAAQIPHLLPGEPGPNQPRTPGPDVGLQDYRETPARTKGRFTYVGATERYRVYEIGDGRGRIEEHVYPAGKRNRWNLIGERDTVDEALVDAKALARGGALPEPTAKPVSEPNVTTQTALPETPATNGRVTEPPKPEATPYNAREPRPGANRLIERANALAEGSPELAAARDRFLAEATPDVGRRAARARIEAVDYSSQPPEVKRAIRLEEVTDNIEAVVGKDLPAFQRAFPDERVDPASLMTERRYRGPGGGKRSFPYENDRWLAQAYVFEGRDDALAVLETKAGVTPEIVSRLKAARAAIDQELLPGMRFSEAPQPASEATKARRAAARTATESVAPTPAEATITPVEGGFRVDAPGEEPRTTPSRTKAEEWKRLADYRLKTAPAQMGSGPMPYRLRQAYAPREAAAPFPASGAVANPNPNVGLEAFPTLPPQVQAVLDARFTGAFDPTLADMTVDQVYQKVRREIETDQAVYRDLAAKGYSPENYRGERAPQYKRGETRIRVQVGEEPVGRRGKTRPVYEWRNVETAAGDPNEAMAALRSKYKRFGDIATGDPAVLARKRTAWARMVDADPRAATRPHLLADLLDALVNRLPRNLIVADPITSWDYSLRNLEGNELLSAIGGGGTPGVRHVYRQGVRPGESVAADLEGELFGPKARGAPSEMAQETSKLDPQGAGRDTPARELARKLHVDFAPRVFDWKKGIDHTIERGSKLSAYATILHGFAAEAIDPFAERMGRYAARRGIGVGERELADGLWALRGPAGAFNQHQVYDLFYRAGLDAGAGEEASRKFAQTAAREWNAAAIDVRERAVAQANRIFPERRLTNLDRYAGWLTLFHFWPTRSAKYLAEEMIRDPRLIHWWLRSHQGLERMAQEGGYPSSVQGLMWLANTPFGWALYANPAGLYLVTLFQQDTTAYPNPEGETRIGRYVRELREKTGLGPTPWLDALLNVTGVYGDALLPNPLPSGTIPLVGAAIDAIAAHTGHHHGDPIYQKAMAYLRSVASGAIPGTTKVPYVDPAERRRDPVANEVLRQNPALLARLQDPETAADAETELARIMNEDNGDPRLAAAERAVADNGLFTQVVTNLSPLPVKAKNPVREDLLDAAKAARQVPYDERTPRQQAVVDARNATTQTPEGLATTAELDQLAAIGSERQRKLAEYWTVIAQRPVGEDLPFGSSVRIGDRLVRAADLVGLTEDQRKALADEWVRTQGGTAELKDYRSRRDAFLAAHPERAGDYKAYQQAAYGYAGGVTAFRRDLAKRDPNFARAMDAEKERIGGGDPAVLKRELDNWTVSQRGYEAAVGIKGSVYDPEPRSTGDGWKAVAADDKVLAGGPAFGVGGSRLDTLKRHLAEYQAAREAFVAAEGTTPEDVAWNPLAVGGAKARGTWPDAPKDVRLYLAWAGQQPAGTDTSPEAFDAYLDELASRPAA